MAVEIPLLRTDSVALVDEGDAAALAARYAGRWRLNNDGYVMASFYVRKDSDEWGLTPGKVHTVYLHRLVMGDPGRPHEIHHRNYNKLDNRRANLEVCTRAENMKHMNGHCKPWLKRKRSA